MTNNNTTEYLYCVIHGRLEPATPDSVICTECGHVYENDLELILAYNEQRDEIVKENFKPGWRFWRKPQLPVPVETAAEVLHCPLCLHDF